MENSYFTNLHFLADRMNGYFDLFGASMVKGTGGEVNCVNIVTIYNSWTWNRLMQFLKNLSDRAALSENMCNGPVFCFCARHRPG
jgi:hypothetical protein